MTSSVHEQCPTSLSKLSNKFCIVDLIIVQNWNTKYFDEWLRKNDQISLHCIIGIIKRIVVGMLPIFGFELKMIWL